MFIFVKCVVFVFSTFLTPCEYQFGELGSIHNDVVLQGT